jgi:hypothetical protein
MGRGGEEADHSRSRRMTGGLSWPVQQRATRYCNATTAHSKPSGRTGEGCCAAAATPGAAEGRRAAPSVTSRTVARRANRSAEESAAAASAQTHGRRRAGTAAMSLRRPPPVAIAEQQRGRTAADWDDSAPVMRWGEFCSHMQSPGRARRDWERGTVGDGLSAGVQDRFRVRQVWMGVRQRLGG